MSTFWCYQGKLEAVPGSYFDDVAKEAIEIARRYRAGWKGTTDRLYFAFDFNGVEYKVWKDTNVEELNEQFWKIRRAFAK